MGNPSEWGKIPHFRVKRGAQYPKSGTHKHPHSEALRGKPMGRRNNRFISVMQRALHMKRVRTRKATITSTIVDRLVTNRSYVP